MWNRIRTRVLDAAIPRLLSAEGRLRAKLRGEEGAMTIEYILIIALIAIIIITLFTVLLWPILRPALEGLIDRISNAINGGGIT
jgi:Flp pilus assembly pilin Flp